ncbi:TetR/AcrR family transcriptional regulator [Paraburkholderia caribensis]|uniref:TetR/AcrR family transcriptional regulator n=1 Tax=Paraburkholderia caribensis TaxID=75105 RepID=UPI001CB5AB0E|nr:TetR/AcrR family transcriptional regulator [Paraburkholderia caribensis]CAG9249565.1 TetR family transcriptional regulator [Paraburkholderia caribensis]
MVRVTREQANENREEIVSAAAKLFAERGPNGASITDLMRGLGRTHGGFYSHFGSKEEIVVAAIKRAFEESSAKLDASDGDAEVPICRVLESHYLEVFTEGGISGMCPSVIFAVDVNREPEGSSVREAFATGLNGLVQNLISRSTEGDTTRSRLLQALMVAVGAALLSGATLGDAISDELLNAARRELKSLLADT